MRIVCLLLCFILKISLYAQNAKEDFIKINESYLNASLNMKIVFSVYQHSNDKAPILTQTGVMKSMKGSRYYNMEHTETLEFDSLKLVVNHLENKISLYAVHKESGQGSDAFGALDRSFLEETLKHCKSVVFNKENGRVNSYELEMKTYGFSHVKIYFNKKDYLLTRIVFVNKKPVKDAPDMIEVVCNYLDFKKASQESFFDLSRFVNRKKSGGYTPTEKYKSYKVIDLYSNRTSRK